MIALLSRGGPQAQLILLLAVLGLPLLVLAGTLWFRRQNPGQAALDAATAARKNGESLLSQYEIGRDAALKAAQPVSAGTLGAVALAWVGIMLLVVLVNFLVTPGPLLVADILRGRYELPPGQTSAEFARLISRSLISGSMAALVAIPSLTIAACGYAFLRSWLLGSPLDQALSLLIAEIDPDRESPRLQKLAEGLRAESNGAWSATGFLLGPFWYLLRGRFPQALMALPVWLVLLVAGFAAWWLPGELIWAGDPMGAGTTAGLFWFYFRQPLASLFLMPLAFYVGIKGKTGFVFKESRGLPRR